MRKLRGNGENEEMSFSFHFLILFPFPHSLLISSFSFLLLNIISLYCDWRLYFSFYICIGRALSSPKTPHQVLKIRNPKTTNLDIDDKYTRKLCWLDHFHFPASCSIFTPGHYPEESTILGENPLKELTPAVRYQTICTKIKVSPPLLLQPPCAPPAGIPLSFWCCWRKVKGTSLIVDQCWKVKGG